jgi:hypothetical protein
LIIYIFKNKIQIKYIFKLVNEINFIAFIILFDILSK